MTTWLTTRQAAEILSVNQSTVIKALKADKLTGHKVYSPVNGQGEWRIDAGSIENWKIKRRPDYAGILDDKENLERLYNENGRQYKAAADAVKREYNMTCSNSTFRTYYRLHVLGIAPRERNRKTEPEQKAESTEPGFTGCNRNCPVWLWGDCFSEPCPDMKENDERNTGGN